MKKKFEIYNTDTFVFGGFDGNERLFFLLPSIRISYVPYGLVHRAIHIGFGILFWEFVFTVEFLKEI